MMSWRIPMVDLEAEYAEVGEGLEAAVLRVLRSRRFVLGPECEALEHEVADRVGAAFAVAVGSGTDALTLSLRALGIGAGDEVVVPAFTYFATVEAVVLAGATPVFVDVEADGFNLDAAAAGRALSERTRAVVPVHLFGRCADLTALDEVVRGHDVAIVEDAAQAIGAVRDGHAAGARGTAGCFSFYPSKNLGAAGDGGCITTSDAALAERLRLLRSHGITKDGLHVVAGTTSRLDDLQAAVLRSKLPHLKGWTEGRVRNARVYAEALVDCPGVVLPEAPAGETIVWNQYTLRCREPAPVRAALESAGIEWRHYYPRPVCCEPGLGALRRDAAEFPNAARACAEAVSVPVRGSCDPETIREIAAVVRAAAR